MASLNKKPAPELTETHGGAITEKITNAEELLRRSVMACMLWEDSFYEDGKSIADRILSYVKDVSPERVAEIAMEARTQMKLRHVPLLITRQMARLDTHKYLVAKTLYEIIQRPDELSEFLAIYWKDKKEKLSAQVKKGLARAITKFNEYSLAKYNQDGAVKLRDVLFLSHAKPDSGIAGYTRDTRKKKNHQVPQDEGSQLFTKLVTGTLKTPDTWEVEISAKGNNAASWTRLVNEKKLGDMAVLKNLRNMIESGVSHDMIRKAIDGIKGDRVLPFRYISAAKYAPKFEPEIEQALFRTLDQYPKLPGKTIIVIDISGSMGGKLSAKSDMDRLDAACAMAAIARELCEIPVIYATAGDDGRRIHATIEIPARRGFALAEAIKNSRETIGGGGVFLRQVTDFIREKEKTADRILVITDEQDCDRSSECSPDTAIPFGKNNYILNVGTYEKGIAYKKWIHISGWSEAIIDYIRVYEEGQNRPVSVPKTAAGNDQAKRQVQSGANRKGIAHAKGASKTANRDTEKRVPANRTVRKGKQAVSVRGR